MKHLKILTLMMLFFCAKQTLAVTLDVRNGILYGASGIQINGHLYAVKFDAGSCVSNFKGCYPSSFIFNTSESVNEALSALDQVIFDGPLGLFHSKNSLIHGCSPFEKYCQFITPYDAQPLGQSWDPYVRYNYTNAGTFLVYDSLYNYQFSYVYAVWEKLHDDGTPIPEPTSFFLIILMILSFLYILRKNRI